MNALVTAEQAVLRIAIENPDQCGVLFARYPAREFAGPNRLVAEAVNALHVRRQPIDALLVNAELQRRGTLGRVGPAYVHDLPIAISELLDGYLDELVRALRLRRLSAVGAQLSARAEADGADPGEVARLMVSSGQAVLDAQEADGDITTQTLGEFLAGEDPEYDWVVPGLLERADRLILTGSEGLGKSTLFRQMAVTVAAGVHPFTGKHIRPQVALYVDCENGPSHMRRKLRGLAIQARQYGGGADRTMFVEGKHEGLDLTRGPDAAWLVRTVSAIQPAVLFTGSLYKMFEADPSKEEPARAVAAVLDRCRAAANCAVVIEAHSGHGTGMDGKRNVRPNGSSLWLRWPEFGYGIRPGKGMTPQNRFVDFVGWRGDRDERSWPKHLQAGGVWGWQEGQCENTDCCGWTPRRVSA